VAVVAEAGDLVAMRWCGRGTVGDIGVGRVVRRVVQVYDYEGGVREIGRRE
jgi:hypothetical protein